MRHRGPDDEGYLILDAHGQLQQYIGKDTPAAVRRRSAATQLITSELSTRSTLALGHRRLSIQDVSPAGHQPMRDATGRYWIVFNGEIYNFKKLRCQLESHGHRFHSASDTEVILAAYSQWKEECLTRLNGDFAFALWDHQQRSLFCARDRIGIKPFYYHYDDNRFVFGSDIKALIASGLYQPAPDPHGLYLSMAFGMAPRPITAFKGVRALEQAHWMRLHADGRIEKDRYWQIPVGTQHQDMSEAEAIELLEEQLQLAVSRRLVADVPVGTFMSGGIDSTTISAIAARQHPGIKAFTLGYENDSPELDEVSQATSTARMHPMQHIVSRVDPNREVSNLSAWIQGYEEPYYSIAANYVISKLVKANAIKVVLNGLGGDELFYGYGLYRYHRYPRWPWLQPLARHADAIPVNRVANSLRLLSVRTPDRMHTLLFSRTNDQQLRRLLSPAFHPNVDTADLLHDLYAKELCFTDTLEAMSFMDLINYIGNHHVHRVDQFSMAHSIEGRFPFLDHELIAAAFRIPSSLKIRNGVQKHILRKVAERHIAPACLAMGKKGFGLPLTQWMRGPLRDVVSTSLNRLCRRSEIIPETIVAWREAYDKGRFESSRIWHLVALELWFEHFIDPGKPQIPIFPSNVAPPPFPQ